ncbi:MAG: hypothetical protein ACHP6H_02120 [Legionellales bacterium]
MSHQINVVRIKGVYNALDLLKDDVVFVGGATVSLYADNPLQTEVRPTMDIDVLVEILTYGGYVKIQETLAGLGFQVDKESKIICRYRYQGLIVDIMPIDEGALGFSNKWYKEGYATRNAYVIDERTKVNIFRPAYFIASKLEAFKGRGKNDGRQSPDFEDIVFVLDNRKKIWEEMKQVDTGVRQYLITEFKRLVENPHIDEWIACHLEPTVSTARTKKIIDAMKEFLI